MTTARRTCLILLIVSLVLVGRQLTRARSPAPTAPDSSGQAPGAIASEHDPGPAPSGATPRAEPSLGEGELGRALGGLEHFAGAVPRDTFDPAAVAALTGADVDAVFTWVRDQTTLVAYRGALRGPSGVLMDGLGNSLDRALLLQELLRQHGHDVRLARVELTAGQAPGRRS